MQFDRSPKVTFDAAAEDYDSFRPSYPSEAVHAMVSLSALQPDSRLLEVGCGTGQATVLLAKLGYRIDAIELGAHLAAIAAENCAQWPRVRINIGTFEAYEPPCRDYRLVYSAQAFHWIDPDIRLKKTAGLLKPGGSLCLLYNTTPKVDGALAVLSDKLQELTGNPIGSPQQTAADMARWREELSNSGLYNDVHVSDYPWDCRYGVREYQGLFRTYSDFRTLTEDLQRKTAEVIAKTIEENGGSVVRRYVCKLIHAKVGK
jgi:SAM-dependent methyltransferase